MPAVFITGTGTDIGKTFVTCGLVRHFRRAGRVVTALKPIVSGFDPEAPHGSDPALLLDALGAPVTEANLAQVSPWRFRAALSPDMAARAEGRSVPFETVVAQCRDAIPEDDRILLVEGAGGVMAPLDPHHTMLNLMVRLGVPVLLVGGTYLGALSHILTAQAVLLHRGLDLAGIVICESEASTVTLEASLETLANFADAPIRAIARMRDTARLDAAFARLEPLILSDLGAGNT